MTTRNEAALAEVLCAEKCAQAGDPPCSRVSDDPHCDECIGMAKAVAQAIRALKSDEPQDGLAAELASVFEQFRNDLKSAHAEICKLQDLDPKTHDWPEWSPQANTLRWLDELEPKFLAALRGGSDL